MNTCVINIEEKDYTLCLTRNSVKAMERAGFNIQAFTNQPITMIDYLWYGGFIKEYKLSLAETNELLEKYQDEGGDVTEVVEFLAQEYASFVSAPTDTKPKKKATINKVK